MKTCIKCGYGMVKEDLECLDEDDVRICDKCREGQYKAAFGPYGPDEYSEF